MGGSIAAAVVKPAVRGAGRAADAALERLLDARLTGDVVERLAASPLAARAARGALQGPLVEAVAADLVRYRVADRLLSEGLLEQTTARVLEGDEFEYVVQAALESPRVERLIGSAIESRLLDQAVVRLLESDDLWLIVDEIASSPAVTAAIAQQSASFADQVAGGVRSRSLSADAWLEQRARKAFRRRPAPPPGPGAG
jgi:hypothetical protein